MVRFCLNPAKLKYLGLILDDMLTWKHDINELSKKMNISICVMYTLKRYCSDIILK